MDKKTVETITRKVARQFPEVADVRPKVQRQNGAQAKSAFGRGAPKFLLTYIGEGKNPLGKSMPRNVRVIADEDGNIHKISTSR
jgi:hypothetical protein